MLQLYPNPAGNEFVIAYEMDKTETVKVELFNMLGESIGTLLDGTQTQGKHSQRFRSSDYNLQAGVYFIKIMVNGKAFSEKLVVNG